MFINIIVVLVLPYFYGFWGKEQLTNSPITSPSPNRNERHKIKLRHFVDIMEYEISYLSFILFMYHLSEQAKDV